ncbi:MAG: GldG family protein [Candidatus Nitrohelix vancouverensis]|uniref:GldG family protein n=1 Tax=Candidatus Nitrohelix vancouverensis TaxID=2705534 RepID=A0A7T0C215_9BACT|nr:MAG: GldG family protein [Candidatus Nitrohelix vancouverensis]
MSLISIIAAWSALFMGLSASFLNWIAPDKVVWIYSLLGGCAVAALYFLIAERRIVLGALKSRSATHGMNSFALVAIVVGILVFVNLISLRHKSRIDLTEGGFFTLSEQTEKVASSLPRDVKMTAFFQTESPEKNQFKSLGDGYLELSEKLSLDYVDPDKNPGATKRYGVTSYGTIVLESGGKEARVQNPTEENLTNALIKVTSDQQKTLYFLSGHDEKRLDDPGPEGYSTIKASLEKDGYQVKEFSFMTAPSAPDDANLIVIPGPKRPFQEAEIKALDAYLEGGGAVFVLLDPQLPTGLEDFLLRWGVKVQNDLVVDPISNLFGGDSAAPVVNTYVPHDITKNFSLPTIFPLLRSVTAVEQEGLRSEEILLTGANSWAETDVRAGKARYDADADIKGPVPVMVAVTKDLAPATEDATDASSASAESENIPQARLAVVGDSDFAGNNYFNFSGNGDFFLNAASYLAEEQRLISIRPRERKNNPLQLTRSEGNVLFVFGVILFPGCVVAAGIASWWKRRRL